MPSTDHASAAAPPLSYAAPRVSLTTHYRWVICALLFFGTTINYIDRVVIGILAPELRDKLHINKEQFGDIMFWFGISYAAGQAIAGGILDKIGTRIGYALALTAWSLVSMGHALVRTAGGFMVMRTLLGVAESPCYPANNKTSAEWFPKRERATVMGFCNAGTNVGIVTAMIMVPLLTKHFGWQGAFLGTGALGLLWLAFWIPIYRRPHEHPRVSAHELAHINSDPAEPAGSLIRTPSLPEWLGFVAAGAVLGAAGWGIGWGFHAGTLLGSVFGAVIGLVLCAALPVLRYRQAWAFTLPKFITDAIWMFYFAWLPTLLNEKYGLDLTHLGWQLVVVYVLADLGSIGGGWMSSTMIRRGSTINVARKTTMALCALCVVPVMFAMSFNSMWACTLLLGMATAGHQGFSANQYALVSDMFPKRAVGAVSGMGGMFGYVGGAIYNKLCGHVLTVNGNNWTPLLIVAGIAYLVAFMITHLFAPHMEPAKLGREGRGFEVLPPAAA
jgi:MFS transporter, ACS family, hexuronate transporter